jgi:flap endonuclease-1
VSDAKRLIELMGVPVVSAPSEGEAQCAALVKQGLAYATASEDMDSLTLGSTILLRDFNSKKTPPM